MHSPTRIVTGALLLTATLLLSGCLPPQPEIVPPPEQAASPLFASDEEALAAATDAYEAYLKMSDLIAQEGGKEPERIAPLVTTAWLPKEINGFNALSTAGRHQVGSSKFDRLVLQQVDRSSGNVVISIYVCHDPTAVRILDATENDVTPPQLGSLWMAEVTFETHLDSNQLQLSGNDPWIQNDIC